MKYRIALILIVTLSIIIATSVAVQAKPIITADTTYYDVDAGLYILKGNVHIEVNNRIITAGLAKVSLSSLEVWASDGISLTEGDIYLVADSVHVLGSQSKSIIEGNVSFKRTGLEITADKAEFNWKTKHGIFSGNVRVADGDNIWTGSSINYNVETNKIDYSF